MLNSGKCDGVVGNENTDSVVTNTNPVGLVIAFEFLEVRNLINALTGKDIFKGYLFERWIDWGFPESLEVADEAGEIFGSHSCSSSASAASRLSGVSWRTSFMAR